MLVSRGCSDQSHRYAVLWYSTSMHILLPRTNTREKNLTIFTFLSWHCAMCTNVNCHTVSWAWRKTASSPSEVRPTRECVILIGLGEGALAPLGPCPSADLSWPRTIDHVDRSSRPCRSRHGLHEVLCPLVTSYGRTSQTGKSHVDAVMESSHRSSDHCCLASTDLQYSFTEEY